MTNVKVILILAYLAFSGPACGLPTQHKIIIMTLPLVIEGPFVIYIASCSSVKPGANLMLQRHVTALSNKFIDGSR